MMSCSSLPSSHGEKSKVLGGGSQQPLERTSAWAQQLWTSLSTRWTRKQEALPSLAEVLPSLQQMSDAVDAVVSSPRTRLGDFDLTDTVLGEGGYARVVLGKHRQTRRKVAVKLLSLHASEGRAAVSEAAVVREVGALRRCGAHPNICHMYGYFRRDDGHALVLEMCVGGELFALVEQHGALPEARVRGLAQGIVAGLSHLHERGIAHRDLKLENILLGGEHADVPKIVDLGLAHVHSRADDGTWAEASLTQFCGSRSYCPPEVMARIAYSGYRADLWSLGVCLFGMASGFFPVDEATPRDWRFERLSKLQLQTPARSTTHEIYRFYGRDCPLSPALVALLDAIVQIQPARRLPLARIAASPWLAGVTQLPPAAAGATLPTGAHEAQSAVTDVIAAADAAGGASALMEVDAVETVYRSRACDLFDEADGQSAWPLTTGPPPALRRQQAQEDVAAGGARA